MLKVQDAIINRPLVKTLNQKTGKELVLMLEYSTGHSGSVFENHFFGFMEMGLSEEAAASAAIRNLVKTDFISLDDGLTFECRDGWWGFFSTTKEIKIELPTTKTYESAPLFWPCCGRDYEGNPAYIKLNCQSGVLSAETSESENASDDERHERVLAWRINEKITAGALDRLLGEISPYAEVILEGYFEDFTNRNAPHLYGVYTREAQEAIDYVGNICKQIDPHDDLVTICDCSELGQYVEFSEAWPSSMTLDEAVKNFVEEVCSGVILTNDPKEYLLDRAQDQLENYGRSGLTEAQLSSLCEERPYINVEDEDEEEEDDA